MRNLKPSSIAAYLALFVALGGVSYAAVSIPANSVGTRQIRNHSVTAAKLAKTAQPLSAQQLRDVVTAVVTDPANDLNITVTTQKGDTGDVGAQGPKGDVGPAGPTGVPGVQGLKGDKGDQGTPGGSWGYGRVAENGTLSAAGGLTVTHPSTGYYCVNAVMAAHVAVATVEGDGASTRAAVVQMAPAGGEPCAGHDAQIATAVSGSAADAPFYVMVN